MELLKELLSLWRSLRDMVSLVARKKGERRRGEEEEEDEEDPIVHLCFSIANYSLPNIPCNTFMSVWQ